MPKPHILSYTGFRKLRGQQKKPLLIYLDEKQFAKLVNGSNFGKGKPSAKGIIFTLAKLPLTPGGFLEISAPHGRGPYIAARGVMRINEGTDGAGCAPVLTSDGIIVCKGGCLQGACGLALAPVSIWLRAAARGAARMIGRISTTVQSGGCGCK